MLTPSAFNGPNESRNRTVELSSPLYLSHENRNYVKWIKDARFELIQPWQGS